MMAEVPTPGLPFRGPKMSSRPARRARDATFAFSVGLREGWDAEGRAFDVSEAVRTARAWIKRRVESGQPALSGMFTTRARKLF